MIDVDAYAHPFRIELATADYAGEVLGEDGSCETEELDLGNVLVDGETVYF
jgi:hypothetical protein